MSPFNESAPCVRATHVSRGWLACPPPSANVLICCLVQPDGPPPPSHRHTGGGGAAGAGLEGRKLPAEIPLVKKQNEKKNKICGGAHFAARVSATPCSVSVSVSATPAAPQWRLNDKSSNFGVTERVSDFPQ